MNDFPTPIRDLLPSLPDQCKHISVQDLRVFLAVSQAGGIRKASYGLGIGQSAVTRRIQRLEDGLGVSLFERSQAGVRLTGAGWDFSERARALVNDLRIAISSARVAGEGRNGHLRLGVLASLSQGPMRELVSSFVGRYPQIDLTFSRADRGELITQLNHRTLDLVFASGAPNSADGDSMLFTEEPVFLAVARFHMLATKASLQWSDLIDANFVVSTDEPGPEVSDHILRRVSDLGRQARVQHHRLDREGIMSLVGLGLGVSPMCEHWCGVNYPDVTFVPMKVEGEWECLPFSLRWRGDNDNPALRRFLSLAREAAKAGVASSWPS